MFAPCIFRKITNTSLTQVQNKNAPKKAVVKGSSSELCVISEPSETHPALHSSVEIRHDPHVGRHAVAVRDIKMGTTLVNESPATFTLHPVSECSFFSTFLFDDNYIKKSEELR